MGSRFVRPDRTVLHISQGDTLTVRKRLNTGETRAANNAAQDTRPNGQLVGYDYALVEAYLIDWTIKGFDGEHVPIRDKAKEDVRAAFDNLDPAYFSEIFDAVFAHTDAMKAERNAEKNAPAGETNEPKISPLPSDAVGASLGSAS